MKYFILAISLVFTFQLTAQNKWTVLAGSSPQPYYSPSTLTIEVGDTVVWENIQGFHDVVTTSGPEDFSYGPPGSAWTHEFVFIQEGIYTYECSVGNHAATQFGSITVVSEQTKYTVVAGSTPQPYYSPSLLTVQVGDTVVWENIEGFHDVVTTSGPDDFTYGPPGTAWVHEFVFTQAGVYDYECSVGNHAATQFGTITVEGSTPVREFAVENYKIYPNPTSSILNITWDTPLVATQDAYLVLTDILGKNVSSTKVATSSNNMELDMSNYPKGTYFISMIGENQILWTKKVIHL